MKSAGCKIGDLIFNEVCSNCVVCDNIDSSSVMDLYHVNCSSFFLDTAGAQ